MLLVKLFKKIFKKVKVLLINFFVVCVLVIDTECGSVKVEVQRPQLD